MTSLRNRLSIWLVAVTIVMVVLGGTGVYQLAETSMRQNQDATLLQIAKTEIASGTDTGFLHVHETGTRTLDVSGVSSIEKFVWIQNREGQVLVQTLNVKNAASRQDDAVALNRARRGEVAFANVMVGDRSLRTVYLAKQVEGEPQCVAAVGEPDDVLNDTLHQVMRSIAGVAIIGIIVGLIASLTIANTTIRPLDRLAQEVDTLDLTDPHEVANLAPPYREVDGLVQAINELSERAKSLISEREETIDRQRAFVADASHELRTPISNIQGAVEVALRRDRDATEYRAVLATTLTETRRLGALTEDLLTLAKTESSELMFDLQPVDITDLIRESLACLSTDKDVRFESPDEVRILGDHHRLRQAVDNVLHNAVSHATTGIRIQVDKADGRVVLSIANDGPPLTDSEAIEIFSRFRRLDYSRSRNTGGSGLGLSIAKAIIERHGGSISARSNEGWTAFLLVFPT